MGRSQVSGLKIYSFGIVTKDKGPNTDLIEVSPTEELPLIDGPLDKHQVNYNYNLPDAKGNVQQTKITGGGTLTAKWWPLGGGNRATSPDMCSGETVLLLKYADVEDIFWTTIFFEPSLRKQETVCYMFSNEKKPLKAFDKNSSYWFEVDTRNKKVTLHTSTNDNERSGYDLIIDTGAGVLSIKDTQGNSIELHSVDGHLIANINNNADITVPKTIWRGDIQLVGNLHVMDTVTVEGTQTNNANVTVNANLNVNGTITGA